MPDSPESDANKVLEGRDGYLFLTNDTNRVVDQVEGSYRLGQHAIWGTAMAHAARQAFCRTFSAEYHHVIVPDRENVLSQYLPASVTPGRHGLRAVGQDRALAFDLAYHAVAIRAVA